MFHSLLVINSSSRETAVPTDEEEEEEEGMGENKVKKQKKGYFDDKSPLAAEFAAVSPIRSFSASPTSFSFP